MKSGAEGDRTLDLCIANAALSQLSYRPSGERPRILRRHREKVYRLGIGDCGFWIVERGAIRAEGCEALIFEFGKPHKLNQLSQLNELYKRSERNHRTNFNDINK